jgi:hypothetical protein
VQVDACRNGGCVVLLGVPALEFGSEGSAEGVVAKSWDHALPASSVMVSCTCEGFDRLRRAYQLVTGITSKADGKDRLV